MLKSMKSLKHSNFDKLFLKGNANVIDNIYGISIFDMISEKIHFLYVRLYSK